MKYYTSSCFSCILFYHFSCLISISHLLIGLKTSISCVLHIFQSLKYICLILVCKIIMLLSSFLFQFGFAMGRMVNVQLCISTFRFAPGWLQAVATTGAHSLPHARFSVCPQLLAIRWSFALTLLLYSDNLAAPISSWIHQSAQANTDISQAQFMPAATLIFFTIELEKVCHP